MYAKTAGTRMRRIGALAAGFTLTLGLATAIAQPATAAPAVSTQRPAGPVGTVANLVGSLIDFGCANPANQFSLNKLLPAARGPVSKAITCYGKVLVPQGDAGPAATTAPNGLSPQNIQQAYGLTGLSSGGKTVAIVDAFDNPKAEADLNVYRQQFGLGACTTANGCFKKVNQNGQTAPLPKGDAGWGMEIALDLQAVSAVCPDCKILLVEANSAMDTDLMTAIAAAKNAGADAISLSWGGNEDATITAADPRLNIPGVAVVASSGDNGYGVSWPASSQYVTAVGGTTLAHSGGTWSETAWKGAGSGCSQYEPQPGWQTALNLGAGCAKRMVADVSAVADPASGLAVYDTYNSCPFAGTFLSFFCNILSALGLVQGASGWITVGGTSLAAPVIAATYALGKSVSHGGAGAANSWPYRAAPGALYDVTSGSNGSCPASVAFLCTAKAGYDGPTGLGTPRGVSAVQAGGTGNPGT